MPREQRKLVAVLAADAVSYSRLMGHDEAATISALNESRRVFRQSTDAHGGRLIDTAGDSVLAEFRSVVAAVECAVEVQRTLKRKNDALPGNRKMLFRIGVNLGDVIEQDDGAIYGDGVNIAARLQQLAEPGGIAVSRSIHEQVRGRVIFAFEEMGDRQFKNIAQSVNVWRWPAAPEAAATPPTDAAARQEIRFCTASDGVRIAYATSGAGTPIIKTANWLTHLEFDWVSPVWRRLVSELSNEHRLIRYDERGTGLSDWDVDDISFEAWVDDLEAVVDAADIERFSLLGVSQGCPVSIAYAARHPERIERLVLHGGYAKGWLTSGKPQTRQHHEAMCTLIQEGWGQPTPAFRQMFTSLFIPGGTAEQIAWWNELERISTPPDNAVRIYDAFPRVDVTDLLPRVSVPTLVLHSRDDAALLHKAGRFMAAMIPGAQFVTLDSRNHIPLEHEPAFDRFLSEILGFLRGEG